MMNNKMTRTLMAITAAFALTGTASAAAIYAAWDLNEGGTATTTTQYQRGSQTWNQVTNPNENLAATDSEDFTGFATWGGEASDAPNSSNFLTFNATGGANQMNTNVSGAGLSGTGAKTFVAWINPTADTGSIISYSPSGGTENGADLRLLINPSGFLRAEVTGGFIQHDEDLVDGGWRMVAAIFDTDTNSSKFYISGSGIVNPASFSATNRAINTNHTAPAAQVTSDDPNIIIGGDPSTRSFTGDIDMAAVYTGALSETELNDIYTNGVAIPEPGTLALVGIALGSLLFLRRRR